MTYRAAVLLLALAFSVLCRPAFAGADQASLESFVRQGPLSLNDDFARWAEGYHPDWSYWRLGAPLTRPRSAHMPRVQENMDGGMRIDGFDIEIVGVYVEGNLGYARFNATEHLTLADGVKRSVRFSAASLYRFADERWQVLRSSLTYLD